jgi:hypothetical protein
VINWFHPNGEFVAKLVPYISKPELKPQWEQNANTPVINIVEDTLADRFSMLLEKPQSHAYAIRVYDSAKQENKHLCFMNAVNHRVHRCVLNCETDESKTYQVFPANMKLQYYEASETPGMSMWLYDETKEKCIASLKLDAGTWLYFTLPTAKQGTSLTLVIAKTEEESVELMKQIKV